MVANKRLFRFSQLLMYGGSSTALVCLFVVFNYESRLDICYLAIGHILILLAATAVKLGYIVRLESEKVGKKVKSS